MKPYPTAALALLLSLAAPAQAQEPDVDSPRYRAIFEINDLLSGQDEDDIGRFLEERLAPALAERRDELAYELIVARDNSAQLMGATPEGQHGARVRLHLRSGGSGSVTFALEPEPPHRFVSLALSGFDPDAEPLSDRELAKELRAHIDELAKRDEFSGTIVLARGDEVLLREAWGLASKRYGVPNRPDTKFNLGSMNKMFTGVAIAQLVEAGKLSFDDIVGEHLPDYPNPEVAEKVTIHHLLTHTSGLGSYWNDRWEERWTKLREVDDLLPLFADEPLAFEPGELFQYSNAGPVVLGLIIEKVTGQSYYDYIREKVCGPAGMLDTDCYEMDTPVPNLAMGYTMSVPDGASGEGFWRNNLFMHSVRGGPAGGGFSTVDDLLKFSRALQNHELLSPEMTATVITGKVDNGPYSGYGYLFGDDREGGVRSHGHNGGAPGISAELAFYPELGFTVAVMSNYDEVAATVSGLARELIERSAAARR